MRTPLFGLAAGLALVAGFGATATAQTCSFNPGPDVIVGSITGPSNYSSFGGMEALSLGTTSCNLGDQVLDWIASTPDHPVIGGNLYRLQDQGGYWAMEQVGMSWLKHGFLALQGGTCCSNCTPNPGGGSGLGIGCSDPYSSGRNGGQSNLGPRWQVDAHRGVFAYPPVNPGYSGSAARRLEVAITDLDSTSSTTTRFYGESQYVTPDDAQSGNNDNNASYRRLNCTGSGSSWSFSFNGSTQRERPAVMAWVDAGVDPNVSTIEFNMGGEGFFVLGQSVTDLGGGQWHYEYALYNMNSDDSIRAFSIPVGPDVTTQNHGFHDIAYRNGDGVGSINHDGTNWPATSSASALTWEVVGNYSPPSNTNHNALRWGSTYNFRFDANAAPVSGDLVLTTYKSQSAFVLGGVQVPSSSVFGLSFCDSSDGSLAACPCSNPGNPDTGCDNAQGTGGVRLEATAFSPNGSGGGTAMFEGTNYPATATPTFVMIRSTTQVPATASFDGAICVANPVVRVGAGFAIGGIGIRPYTHGAMASAGTNYYQMWYRNQPAMYCTPDAANFSNGYDLTW